MSYIFKICDPIHGFIRFNQIEKQVIDSRPFQRLKYIRQMGVAYLVYPGANHTRFEHSLGVMEFATRIYNTLIEPHHQRTPLPAQEIDYWRQILRLAALCHDLGHLPFSHTAEKSLLPKGGHEWMTAELIRSSELHKIWNQIGPTAEEDLLKLVGAGGELSLWEKVLSQVIVEDNFGADRIDYLIRDGYYTGVRYGHFDYHQLIDSLRILDDQLGVTISGIQSVESLWIARYLMYARVYQHPKSRVYTNHMHRYMKRALEGVLTTDCEDYLAHTDYTLLTLLAKSARQGDYDALCLLKQEEPFCEIPSEHLSATTLEQLEQEFGEEVFVDRTHQKQICRTFPVHSEDKIVSSFEASPFLRDIPPGGKPLCLYVHPQKKELIQQRLH